MNAQHKRTTETPQGWWKNETQDELDSVYLERSWLFKDFTEVMGFLVKVAMIADRRKHHPDIFAKFNYVKLSITTHSNENQLTPADYKLAEEINKLPENERQSVIDSMTADANRAAEYYETELRGAKPLDGSSLPLGDKNYVSTSRIE